MRAEAGKTAAAGLASEYDDAGEHEMNEKERQLALDSVKQGLDALINKPSGEGTKNWREGGYIKKLNKDPWGNEYQYTILDGRPSVTSLGKDNAEGGEGENADYTYPPMEEGMY